MPPPQSFVAPPTPLLRVKWAAGWPISRSPSVSQTKTSGYSQTPEEKQKISLSEKRREREEGRGLGISYAGVRTERKKRERGEREKENVRETEKAHQASPFGQMNTPTLSLVNIWALFLWTMWMYPGGCIQASPSTWAGTASSPIMVIFTRRHYRQKWDLFFQTFQKALIHTCITRLVAYRQL